MSQHVFMVMPSGEKQGIDFKKVYEYLNRSALGKVAQEILHMNLQWKWMSPVYDHLRYLQESNWIYPGINRNRCSGCNFDQQKFLSL